MFIGSLFGVPVRVSPWYVPLVVYVAFRTEISLDRFVDGHAQRIALLFLLMVTFTFSLLAHEFAHVLVARKFGAETEEVLLFVLGGFAKLRTLPSTPGGLFLMSAAGPAANVAIALGLLALGPLFGMGLSRAVADWLVAGNLMLASFNLIIAHPLDGGQMLHAVLWKISGDREKAERACLWLAVAIGPFLTGAGFQWASPVIVFIGMYLLLNGFIRLQKAPAPSA